MAIISVVYVVSTLSKTGPTSQLFNLIKYRDPEKCSATVVTLSPEPLDSLRSEFESLDVELLTLGLSRIKGLISGKKRLRETLAKLSADVIHTQGIRADSIVASLKLDTPHVVSIRNFPHDDYPTLFGKFRGRLMANKHIGAFKTVKNLVFCSESLAARFGSKLQITGSTVQNGVDTEKYTLGTGADVTAIRAELGIPIDQAMIVHIGSLIPRKDPAAALKAFEASNASKSAHLVFIGDGPLSEDLKLESGESSQIIFTGQSSKVSQLLQAADLLISTSKSEGLPNTVLEALASGVRTCLSDIPAHQEIAEKAPEAVKLFPLGDIAAASKCIDDSLASVSQSDSRKYLPEAFDAANNARKYSVIYESVINSDS
jgi:glycosyltransferase involved in cell wall biosynthesis